MKDTTRLAIWLGNKKKNYHQGLDIFKALAVNPDRIKFYTTDSPGEMQKNMLFNDLSRYARIKKITPKTVKVVKQEAAASDAAFEKIIKPQKPLVDPVIESTRIRIFKNPEIDYKELPKELQLLYDKFQGLYTEYDQKREELGEVSPDASNNPSRKQLAATILSLRETIRMNWNSIDSWWKAKNGDGPRITKPSGKYSKVEIENMKDPEIKALSKRMRIEANFKYISRNQKSTDKKTLEKVELRKRELIEWDPDNAEKLTNNS